MKQRLALSVHEVQGGDFVGNVPGVPWQILKNRTLGKIATENSNCNFSPGLYP